jgi:hypothetical protein
LQYNLARLLVERCTAGAAHGYITDTEGHPQHVPHETADAWARDSKAHVAKIHRPHSLLAGWLASDAARVCYIYRDLRDVALSRKTAFGERGDDLIRTLTDHVEWYYTLARARDLHPHAVVWQRYETVIAELPVAIREIAGLLDLDPSAQIVATIAEECGLVSAESAVKKNRQAVEGIVQELRKRDPKIAGEYIRLLGRGDRPMKLTQLSGPELLLHNHVSRHRGAPGSWRDHLDAATLEAVETRFASWLRDAGYEG